MLKGNKKTGEVSAVRLGLSATLSATTNALVAGGSWVASGISRALDTVDPDVNRHLLQLPLLAHSLFAKQDSQLRPGPAEDWPPLVFVHGLGGSSGDFFTMSTLFWLSGRKRSYRVAFGPAKGIEQLAEHLVEYVTKVCKVNDESRVDLIAHSMGGVVARLALGYMGLAHNVENFISLGVPHAGTYPARYGNSKTLHDLRPGSELMKKLNSLTIPDSVKTACLWSKNDLFVLPPESACLDGTLNIEMSPFTHYSYLLDPRSFEVVRIILEGRPDLIPGIRAGRGQGKNSVGSHG